MFRDASSLLRQLGAILGLFQEPVAGAEAERNGLLGSVGELLRELDPARAKAVEESPLAGPDEVLAAVMQSLIALRADARRTKNFAIADQIRQRLAKINVTLEDRPGGTGWHVG